MRKDIGIAAGAIALAALSAGCFGYERTSTVGPSATGASALVGNWTSASLVATPGACSDFRWTVTQQTGNSASGTFSATCPGDIRVSGTASGTLAGSVVTWTAQGTATVANLASCPITLSGTAELGADSIRVPYTGETCLGRVSGVEVLRRT